ncbi:hypothetical protein B0T21DRAFT_362929 [Apiosordaria backusii]|uniref:Secreted protein n=1 Tax=Apiosordaria backusii TaxID=314023 RepID=A0AA40EHT8_9PEZI|nr:hypothetical protein B0T21DRAFT_362929 [Apiosordaria backusii]
MTASGLVSTVMWCLMAPLTSKTVLLGEPALPTNHLVMLIGVATPLFKCPDEAGRFALPARPSPTSSLKFLFIHIHESRQQALFCNRHNS